LFNVLNSKDYRYLVFPPLEQQNFIASYLDTKCAAIDAAIKRKQELIDKMTEYKKSLIYEAVTGKMEV
jgi:type I restriction enzyme S subunit